MPFNKIHVPEALPSDTCRAINDALHEALVEMCAVNPDDYFCLIARYRPDDMILHPAFFGVRDPAATIIIETALLAGRTDDQKERLYRDVRRRLGAIGFDPENAIIYLLENQPIDWSFSSRGSVKTELSL